MIRKFTIAIMMFLLASTANAQGVFPWLGAECDAFTDWQMTHGFGNPSEGGREYILTARERADREDCYCKKSPEAPGCAQFCWDEMNTIRTGYSAAGTAWSDLGMTEPLISDDQAGEPGCKKYCNWTDSQDDGTGNLTFLNANSFNADGVGQLTQDEIDLKNRCAIECGQMLNPCCMGSILYQERHQFKCPKVNDEFYTSTSGTGTTQIQISAGSSSGGTTSYYTCDITPNLFMSNIVPCLRGVVDNIFTTSLLQITEGLGSIVLTVATLALIFLFIKMYMGAVDVKKSTFFFFFKIMLIITICTNTGLITEFRGLLLAFLDAGLEASSSFLDTPNYCANALPIDSLDNILSSIDCMLALFFGTVTGGNDSIINSTDGSSILLSVLGSTATLGANASWVWTMVGGFLVSVTFAFVNIGLLFVVSDLALTFLLCFAPLFFLFLLFNYTRRFFEIWLQHLFYYALQPLMCSMFLLLFLAMMSNFTVEMESLYDEMNDNVTATAPSTPSTNPFDNFNINNLTDGTAVEAAIRLVLKDNPAYVQNGELVSDALSNPDLVQDLMQAMQDLKGSPVKATEFVKMVFTSEFLKKFGARLLGLTFLFILAFSILQALPELTSMMIGQGMHESLRPATSAPESQVNQLMNKSLGYSQQAGAMVKGMMKE